jgi:hypothetical protein
MLTPHSFQLFRQKFTSLMSFAKMGKLSFPGTADALKLFNVDQLA